MHSPRTIDGRLAKKNRNKKEKNAKLWCVSNTGLELGLRSY